MSTEFKTGDVYEVVSSIEIESTPPGEKMIVESVSQGEVVSVVDGVLKLCTLPLRLFCVEVPIEKIIEARVIAPKADDWKPVPEWITNRPSVPLGFTLTFNRKGGAQ